jgi:hypothetical protein
VTTEKHPLDLQREFARYMAFVSAVAGHLLANNPLHNPAAADNPHALSDSRWLAEVIHNFDMLSEAIAAGDAQEIMFVCTANLHRYDEFRGVGLVDPLHGKHRAFERNGGPELLDEGIAVLTAIRLKAHGALSDAPAPTRGPVVGVRQMRTYAR